MVLGHGKAKCPQCSGAGGSVESYGPDWPPPSWIDCELCSATGEIAEEHAARISAIKQAAQKRQAALGGVLSVVALAIILWQILKPN